MTSRPPPTAEIWTSRLRTEKLRESADRHTAASAEETELLLAAAQIGPGLTVLDLACGPGDPTLEVARRIAPEGHVTGVDLSEGALEVATGRAREAGLPNVSFRSANVEALPFPDASFDRAISRFGVMFFEDLDRALTEVRRVLRPRGRVAFMVWGPSDQPYFRSTVGTLLHHLHIGEIPPEKAVPYRFGKPGTLESALAAAGFGGVHGADAEPRWVWTGTPEAVRDSWFADAVFFRSLIDALTPKQRTLAEDEVADRLREFYDGTAVRIPLSVRLITAAR